MSRRYRAKHRPAVTPPPAPSAPPTPATAAPVATPQPARTAPNADWTAAVWWYRLHDGVFTIAPNSRSTFVSTIGGGAPEISVGSIGTVPSKSG